jgi:hypothetical protein
VKRYVFIDGEGNINSIMVWSDERDLPEDYPIPDGCTVKEIDDDSINSTYIYDSNEGKFIVNPNPLIQEAINNVTIKDLQKQIYNLTTLLVQAGGI